MRGLGLSLEELAQRIEQPVQNVESLFAGDYAEKCARLVANQLSLSHAGLHELATNPQRPNCRLPDCISLHNSPFPVPGYEEMTVNSYSVWPDKGADAGLLFDAGSRFESIFNNESKFNDTDWHLFLTHTDPDHVVRFNDLAAAVTRSYAPLEEPYKDARLVRGDDVYKFGKLQVTALQTAGHSPGGTSYLLEGAGLPVAFVGDALFCYSIGKVRGEYTSAISQIKKNLLSLPGETILCPGHGPITTVAFELGHNPFFAEG